MQLVRHAVNPIRSGFQNHVGDRAASPPQLRLVIARRDTDDLDRFGRRNQDLQQTRALIVVGALDLIVVAVPHLAVHFGLQRAAGIEKLRVLEGGRSRTRREVQKTLEVAIDTQRQFFDDVRFEDARGVDAVGLQQGRRAGDFDRFRHATG